MPRGPPLDSVHVIHLLVALVPLRNHRLTFRILHERSYRRIQRLVVRRRLRKYLGQFAFQLSNPGVFRNAAERQSGTDDEHSLFHRHYILSFDLY